MTPCEEKGYKVGQVFECIEGTVEYDSYNHEDTTVSKGSIMVLEEDDRSDLPKFRVIRGMTWDNDDMQYVRLASVRRIYPPDLKSSEVTVICEGKETIISRESAEALNLI